MRKFLSILCMVLALTACKDKQEKRNDIRPTVKIGASFPLTGNMAAIGTAAQKALVAAIDEANKNPDNKYFYHLIIENDQMDPKLINGVAGKFIYQDQVNVMFSYFSVANRIMAPLAAQNKIINFSFGFGDDGLQSQYNFQNFLTVEAENQAVIKFFKTMKIKKVDLVYQNIGAADEFLTPLLALLKQHGIAYNVHRFNKNERDFSILVSKIKNSSSQAVFVYAFEPEADILTKEFHQQRLNKIIAYNDGLPMTNDLALYEGYYNIGSALTPEEYKLLWGLKGQNAAYTTYIYDSGKFIIDAYEHAPTNHKIPTSDEISYYLHAHKIYSGIINNYELDAKGQFHSNGQTSVVKNGQIITYGE